MVTIHNHTFRVKYYQNYPEVNTMKGRILTETQIAAFAVYLKSEEKSENTIEKYMRDVRAFCAYVGEAEMTKETVIAYKNKLLSENYAARSVNSVLASINSLLSFLGWADLKVKSIKLQRQIYCPEEKELTKAEYIRLVNTAKQKGNERLNLLIQTICGTGIRVSELQYITVEAVKCNEAVVSLKGKTRSVFIVRELQKKLLRYAAEQKISSGAIFITRSGKPMSRTNIWREMKSLCVEAGVNPQKVFPHNLRHLFARTFYGIEKDIAKLADILGHSSINTTRIYIITTGNEHRQRMENMRLII
jgi:integrase/recombinase XerD